MSAKEEREWMKPEGAKEDGERMDERYQDKE